MLRKGQEMKKLTLSQAIAENRISDFAKQADADGIGLGPSGAFDALLDRMIKAPQPEGRTSRSLCRGGSPGK